MDKPTVEGAATALAGHSKDAVVDMKAKAADNVESLASRAQAAAGQFGETISETARKVGAAASDAGGQVYETAGQAGNFVVDQVKQRPFTSLLLGMALGYVAAFLLHHTPEPPPRRYRPRGW